jgi:hypothetical protein
MNDVSLTPPNVPPPQRVRLEGKLDMVRASDASFTLIADDGRVIQGRLVGRSIEELARFLNRGVLVFGVAAFDPVGNLMSVEVDGWLPTDNSPPKAPSLAGQPKEVAEEMARRLREVIGTWPGDETDEEIAKALRELS